MSVNTLVLIFDAWTPCSEYLEASMSPAIAVSDVPAGTILHVQVDGSVVAKAVIVSIEKSHDNFYKIHIKDVEEMTPEGKVKKRLKDLLNSYGDELYQYWPVSNGMGAPALDVIICFNGYFLSIEAKAAKKQMTERQEHTAGNINKAKGMTIMINEFEGWLELQSWLGQHG